MSFSLKAIQDRLVRQRQAMEHKTRILAEKRQRAIARIRDKIMALTADELERGIELRFGTSESFTLDREAIAAAVNAMLDAMLKQRSDHDAASANADATERPTKGGRRNRSAMIAEEATPAPSLDDTSGPSSAPVTTHDDRSDDQAA